MTRCGAERRGQRRAIAAARAIMMTPRWLRERERELLGAAPCALSVAGSETYAEAPAKADLWKLVDSDRMDLALPPPKDMVDVGGCCVVCVFAP